MGDFFNTFFLIFLAVGSFTLFYKYGSGSRGTFQPDNKVENELKKQTDIIFRDRLDTFYSNKSE